MEYIAHYGVKRRSGRYPWGSGEKNQNKGKSYSSDKNGDLTIKKGSGVYRVSNSAQDPTYDNKKYVSLTASDHAKWQKYIGDEYNKYGQAYNILYMSVKDLRVANYAKLGDMFTEQLMKNPKVADAMMDDSFYAAKRPNQNTNEIDDLLSMNFAMQTRTGKWFIDQLKKQGYQGVQDRHGQNTSENPVIIFDPDTNLKKTKISLYKPKRIVDYKKQK